MGFPSLGTVQRIAGILQKGVFKHGPAPCTGKRKWRNAPKRIIPRNVKKRRRQLQNPGFVICYPRQTRPVCFGGGWAQEQNKKAIFGWLGLVCPEFEI